MSTAAPEPYETLPGPQVTLPEPGSEAPGPPLSDLVREFARVNAGLHALLRQVSQRRHGRYVSQIAPFQTDGSGNATVKLYEVPAGFEGSLMYAAIDEAGVTPGAPDTRATLGLLIYEAPGAATTVAAVGGLLDCLPSIQGAAAQIPTSLFYGSEYAGPTVKGPLALYLVVQNANATRQCSCRFGLHVRSLDV